jgi:di/tricarboxylate transporter
MTWEMGFVFVVIVVALVLFVTGRYPIDQVAIAIPVVLLVGGVLSPAQAVSGFSNPATVTVAAMLILGLGLVKTGAVAVLARWAFTAPLGSPRTRLMLLCVLVAGVSPFVNNTAVVVVFLPVFLSLAHQDGAAPSRYLMPLSFAAILGGTVALIGTSTNLVIFGIAESHGLTGFSMFTIAPLGVPCVVAGLLYLFTFGGKLIPERVGEADLSGKYQVHQFLAELAVQPDSPAVGRSLGELAWRERYGVSIIGIDRGGQSIWAPGPECPLSGDDVLYAKGTPQQLLGLSGAERLDRPDRKVKSAIDFVSEKARLMEVMAGPKCALVTHTLAEVRFQQRYNATVLAVHRHGVTIREDVENLRLCFGDLLLVHGSRSALGALATEPGFLPLRLVEAPPPDRLHPVIAACILLAVVVVAATGALPIVTSALVGVALMVFTGCVRMDEIYSELDWSVVFLLAGLLPLGIAMEASGAAEWIVLGLMQRLGQASPVTVIAGLYLVTVLLTGVMSNVATAVVVAPIALVTAAELGINPYALLVTIMFGASASFMTPVGYQTNTLIYGPGGYRFGDFLKVGLPLNAILAVVVTVLVPVLWPS